MHKKLLGAYIERDLPVYRLHPMVKMLIPFSFAIATGMVDKPVFMALLIAVYFALGALCGLKPLSLLAYIRPFRFLLIFTFVIQLFLTPAGGWIAPDTHSLWRAAFFTGRMALIIGFSAIFAVITPIMDIVRIFYVLFQPLRLIRINPADTALSMLIALRFIPLLFTEGGKIMDSQRLKGILPEKGEKMPLSKRITSAVSLVVPLFVRTFHYAEQLGVTLLYRSHDSTFFKLPKPVFKDYAAGLIIILFASGVSIASKIS